MTDPTTPPAGWYPDATGAMRWWDGRAWGPYAPAPAAGTDPGTGTTLAVISHLSMVFGAILVPLVVLLIEGKRNQFVRHHATEALNFQITVMLAWIGAIVFFFASTFLSFVATDLPFGFFSMFPLMFLAYFAALGLSILGAVKAGQAEWWRYPVSLRLVSGARPTSPAR